MTENSPVRVELVAIGRFTLEAARRGSDGWVAIKPACEQIGLNFSGQKQRLERQPWAVVCVMHMTGSDGKTYEMFCLRSDKVGMWLASLDTARIKNAEIKADVGELQIGASDALNAWLRGAPVALAPRDSEDSLSLLLRQSEQTAALVRQAIQHRDEIARISGAVIELQAERATALASMHDFPVPATPELPAISLRKTITRIVRAHCEAYRLNFRDTFNAIYKEASYRWGFDVKARARVRKCSPMEVVERDGLGEKLLAVVKHICRETITERVGHA